MIRPAHPAFGRIERAGAVPARLTAALERIEVRALTATRGLDELALLGDCGLGSLLAELSLGRLLDRPRGKDPAGDGAGVPETRRGPAEQARAPEAPGDVPLHAGAIGSDAAMDAAKGGAPAASKPTEPSRATVHAPPRERRLAAPSVGPGPRGTPPAIVPGDGPAHRPPHEIAADHAGNRLRASAARAGVPGAADRRVARASSADGERRSRVGTPRADVPGSTRRDSIAASAAAGRRSEMRASGLLEGAGARLGRAADRALETAEAAGRHRGVSAGMPAETPGKDGRWPAAAEAPGSGLRRLAAWASSEATARGPSGDEEPDDPALPQAALDRMEESTLSARMTRLLRREALREGVDVTGVTA
jgi:hypothetical protein